MASELDASKPPAMEGVETALAADGLAGPNLSLTRAVSIPITLSSENGDRWKLVRELQSSTLNGQHLHIDTGTMLLEQSHDELSVSSTRSSRSWWRSDKLWKRKKSQILQPTLVNTIQAVHASDLRIPGPHASRPCLVRSQSDRLLGKQPLSSKHLQRGPIPVGYEDTTATGDLKKLHHSDQRRPVDGDPQLPPSPPKLERKGSLLNRLFKSSSRRNITAPPSNSTPEKFDPVKPPKPSHLHLESSLSSSSSSYADASDWPSAQLTSKTTVDRRWSPVPCELEAAATCDAPPSSPPRRRESLLSEEEEDDASEESKCDEGSESTTISLSLVASWKVARDHNGGRTDKAALNRMQGLCQDGGPTPGRKSCLKGPVSVDDPQVRPSNLRVSFDRVTIREYNRVIGASPACSSGAPVSLGWQCLASRDFTVDSYEQAQPVKRSKRDFHLSAEQRKHLLSYWGYGPRDVSRACRDTTHRQFRLEQSARQETRAWHDGSDTTQPRRRGSDDSIQAAAPPRQPHRVRSEGSTSSSGSTGYNRSFHI